MNKYIIGILVIAAIGLGWFLFSNNDTFDYVVTVDNEVAQLETELAELDVDVEAGTLTSAQATEAKVKILTRLETINATVAASASAKLTPAQQQQLNDGLNRLKTILINFQATLTSVDEKANAEDVQAKLNKGGKSNKTLNAAISETIDTVETNVEETVEDYVADEELDAQVDIIMEDESATSSDPTEDVTGDEDSRDDGETTGTTTDSELDTTDQTDTPTSTEEVVEEEATL